MKERTLLLLIIAIGAVLLGGGLVDLNKEKLIINIGNVNVNVRENDDAATYVKLLESQNEVIKIEQPNSKANEICGHIGVSIRKNNKVTAHYSILGDKIQKTSFDENEKTIKRIWIKLDDQTSKKLRSIHDRLSKTNN